MNILAGEGGMKFGGLPSGVGNDLVNQFAIPSHVLLILRLLQNSCLVGVVRSAGEPFATPQ